MNIQQKNSAFDLPVEGVSDNYKTMQELMADYKSFAAARNYEKARECLESAVQSEYLPAKIELARFLRDTTQLHIPFRERMARAEKLYNEVLNILELPEKVEALVALDLATLYEHDRPVRYLACLLKAKRLGSAIPLRDIETCRRRLARMDVNTLGDDSEGAYQLGVELSLAGDPFHFAEIFLREACEAQDQELAGRACLALAELYSENTRDCPNHRLEAQKYFRLAAQKGFPEAVTQDIWRNR